MPAVSVIMPAFNVEGYLSAAIDSVLAQTFADLELIVVDDGSTDRTAQIAEQHARRDGRVCVIRQLNRGISAARNRGLAAASGAVIAILDSDDLWAPAYLSAQMGVLESHPEVDIVTANAWFLGGPQSGCPARPTPDPRPAPTLLSILCDETAVFIMSIFRRRVPDAIGGFDETLRTNEDYDYWLRAAAAGFRFFRNDVPLGYYRRRNDSLSANEVTMLRGILQVLIKLRPSIADRVPELAALDSQILRFDTERLAAETRAALERRDFKAARVVLASLYERSGGMTLHVASLMARWTPRVLALLYEQNLTRRIGARGAGRTRTRSRDGQPGVARTS